MQDWISLRPYWTDLRRAAEKRQRQKRGFASTRDWNANTHFVGLCGEQTFAVVHDLAVDMRLRLRGDRGRDFVIDGETVDVKATPFWRDPWLKSPAGDRLRADWYALVGVDLDERRGRYFGRVRRDVLASAPVRVWRAGGEPTRSLPVSALRLDPGASHVHGWSRSEQMVKVPEVGYVPAFTCRCGEAFVWTPVMAAEYLRR